MSGIRVMLSLQVRAAAREAHGLRNGLPEHYPTAALYCADLVSNKQHKGFVSRLIAQRNVCNDSDPACDVTMVPVMYAVHLQSVTGA